MNILITGATGFVGQGVIADLLAHTSYQIHAVVRPRSAMLPDRVKRIEISGLDGTTDLRSQLDHIEVVIHLAARVHQKSEDPESSYKLYRALNTEGTLNLARQAATSGTRRFIYLSTIKVNGEQTEPGRPFNADDPPDPSDAYARTKCEAERGLRELSSTTELDHVIIRPPLVYGPGVKANFLKFIDIVSKGIPLPLASINNRRSLVSLDNLTSLIRLCIDHPLAANETFLVADDNDVSTAQLVCLLARALGKPCRLFPLPKPLLDLAANFIGKKDVALKLLENLQVDVTKTKSLLGWRPVCSLDIAMRNTVMAYLNQTT